jgi:hypothetical protein
MRSTVFFSKSMNRMNPKNQMEKKGNTPAPSGSQVRACWTSAGICAQSVVKNSHPTTVVVPGRNLDFPQESCLDSFANFSSFCHFVFWCFLKPGCPNTAPKQLVFNSSHWKVNSFRASDKTRMSCSGCRKSTVAKIGKICAGENYMFCSSLKDRG